VSATEPDAPPAPGNRAAPSVGRLLLYYALFSLVAMLAVWRFPEMAELLRLERLSDLGIMGDFAALVGEEAPAQTTAIPMGWEGAVVAVVSLLAALFLTLPVAWTYIFVKRNVGYDESVVHTLLILPVAVTGIVLVVKGSLALAFSLAGIVAAVRFRTTLEDVKDAVYVFLAIGIGLAAGVQALGVAAALSLVFNVLNLVLWKINFGNIYADQRYRTGGLSLGDALAGAGSSRDAVAIGDARLMAALGPKEIGEVAALRARMDRYLEAEAGTVTKDRKQFSVLMVYAPEVGPAQAVVEALLPTLTARWSLAEVLPGDGETSILEYLVRLRDDVSAGALLDAIRAQGGPSIRAAEIRSLKAVARSP
jgi:hypothetical protein